MENWVIKNKKADFESIATQCGISEVIARCLVNKGLCEPARITEFLHPDLHSLYSPYLLKDMNAACLLLKEKILNKSPIRIIGDYDVDGVISTYILYIALKKLGANIDYEIPDRIKDGYGINVNIVKAAYDEKVDTIITCDNGIAAIDQITLAKEFGMNVIITDHHSLIHKEGEGVLLPPADAIINPKQPDCTYPFQGLCGAAIAYKLCIALMEELGYAQREEFGLELLSYTAIATVCDVMDLIEENRIIVKHGLALLKNSDNIGLLALMEASNIEKSQLNSFHLGFVIGPCLNASGRLDTAKKGLTLLLASTKEEAVTLADEVRTLNDVRKNMTQENVAKAIKLIEESEIKSDKVLVILLKDCHESIAGIIAGRVREKYNKPTLILTEAEGCIKGSGRSIEQYDMYEELSKCRELFLKMGGHPMAAGFSLEEEKLNELRVRLNQNTTLTEEMLIPKVSIDIHLPFGYVNESLVEELQMLEPYGKANEKPLFAQKDVKILSAFVIGKNASGIRFKLENQYHRTMEAVYFGDVNQFFAYISDLYGEEEENRLRTGRGSRVSLSITYFPRINEYNGVRTVQLMIQNYR